ncbi:MAG: ABC transporter substrate-binding protein [Stellaceae bacterium]
MRRRDFLVLLGGAGAGLPRHPRAEPTRLRLVGILWANAPAASLARFEALQSGLLRLGYEEGRNISFVQRGPEHELTREGLAALAAELVQAKVEVILTAGTSPTRAAKSAAAMIPTVMTYVSDPIVSGFVESLARPGGNITGLTNFGPELSRKWLELIKELSPRASNVGVLYDFAVRGVVSGLQAAAPATGVRLLPFEVKGDSSCTQALTALPDRHPEALIVFLPPRNREVATRLVAFAADNRLPAVYWWREYVDAGGLAHYGPSVGDMYRRAAVFIDKILKGAKPADLPVEQPTRFDLVINIKTAKALGLDVSPALLARADEVIE